MKVYDLDGVVLDLVGHLITHNYLNAPPESYDLDIDWVEIPVSFWATVPKLDIVLELNRCRLITCCHSTNERIGKILNLHRLGLYDLSLTIHDPQTPRWWLLNTDDILYDDNRQNVEDYRATGGVGVIIQQPWNLQ